jgi:hypothetical protein
MDDPERVRGTSARTRDTSAIVSAMVSPTHDPSVECRHPPATEHQVRLVVEGAVRHVPHDVRVHEPRQELRFALEACGAALRVVQDLDCDRLARGRIAPAVDAAHSADASQRLDDEPRSDALAGLHKKDNDSLSRARCAARTPDRA